MQTLEVTATNFLQLYIVVLGIRISAPGLKVLVEEIGGCCWVLEQKINLHESINFIFCGSKKNNHCKYFPKQQTTNKLNGHQKPRLVS